MPEFSPEVKNGTGRGQERVGREGQAGPVPSWQRSEAHGTVTVRSGEGTGGQLVQIFPQTPNSLACFSVNSKNTQWGNVSKKQIHLLPALLARLPRGDCQAPPQPWAGERFGRTRPCWAEGWCLPRVAAPVPGEGAERGRGDGSRGRQAPLPGRRPSQLWRGQGSQAAHPFHC